MEFLFRIYTSDDKLLHQIKKKQKKLFLEWQFTQKVYLWKITNKHKTINNNALRNSQVRFHQLSGEGGDENDTLW